MSSTQTVIDERQLQLLFRRMTWPSGLVRERACAAIATQLVRHDPAGLTRAYLLRWIREQQLESVAVLGLLVLVRALIEDGEYLLPPAGELFSLVSKPSILSWMLIKELLPDDGVELRESLRHSEAAPPEFVPDPAFHKYIRAYVPPIYEMWASTIEKRERIPFVRQWAYEWTKLLAEVSLVVTERPLNFWLRTDSEKEHYAAADMAVSEVYRSAYLRALAWALSTEALSQNNALYFAAETCPVDLELWRLPPQAVPDWWVRATEPEGKIDTVPAQIWEQVEKLWEEQCSGADEWVVAQTSGRAHQGATIYNLEIYGLFQRFFSLASPDLEEITDWCRGEVKFNFRHRSYLLFKGQPAQVGVNDFARDYGGWSVVPSFGRGDTTSPMRWQFWRMYRSLWMPAPYIGDSSITFGVEDGSLTFKDGEEIIGRWNDWTDGMSERIVEEVPPATGQYLQIRRSKLEQFAQATGSVFCWVCRLTGWHREHRYETYKAFTDYREFGGTRIFRS
jgi:hypothetical protein